MSYTDKWTDDKLEELERHIAGIYRDAYQDLKEKTERYWNGWDEVADGKTVHHAGFKERYEKEYAAYQNGAYTDAEFAAWCRSQTGRGSRWEGARDEMAARLSNANVLAANYINGETPAVFAENANFEAFKIEQANFSADFRLLDETTVKRLTIGKDDIFPQLSISLAEDQLWNRTKLHTQLLQGIIQGERIGQIANRFQTVANMNRSSAIRNARTAVTGAQNAGRHETYERAEKMGIQMEQEWISTSDERTRESHVMMNGVRVKVNERFPNGLRWPGDSTGAPEEIWNCRCTLRSILPKYNGAARTENTVASYNEWKEQKGVQTYWWQEEAPEVAQVKEERQPITNSFTPATTIAEAEEFVSQYVDKNQFGALGVSYSGVSIDVANEINKAISNVYDNFNLEKLGGVFTPTLNSKLGKMLSNATAAYSPIRNSVIVNRGAMKNMKTAIATLKAEIEAVTNYLAHPENYDLSKINKRSADVLRNSAISGRGTVPTTIEEAIYHELGHSLERVLRQNGIENIVYGEMAEYGAKISGYATDSKSEFLAESFASYMKNEDVIGTETRAFFDSLRK